MTTATLMPVRVMVQEVWDGFTFEVSPETTLAELKRKALEQGHVTGDPARYEVKYRGALLRPEEHSLADLGVVPNAALIVLSRRRRPVR